MARSCLYCLLFSWHWHLVCVSPIFASNCLKLNFKLFFLTDVSNYCEERKIKLSVNVYIKIARNLGSNFWNFGSNFLDFWQLFSNLLAFQWATFQHFTSTIGIALTALGIWQDNPPEERERLGQEAVCSIQDTTIKRKDEKTALTNDWSIAPSNG